MIEATNQPTIYPGRPICMTDLPYF